MHWLPPVAAALSAALAVSGCGARTPLDLGQESEPRDAGPARDGGRDGGTVRPPLACEVEGPEPFDEVGGLQGLLPTLAVAAGEPMLVYTAVDPAFTPRLTSQRLDADGRAVGDPETLEIGVGGRVAAIPGGPPGERFAVAYWSLRQEVILLYLDATGASVRGPIQLTVEPTTQIRPALAVTSTAVAVAWPTDENEVRAVAFEREADAPTPQFRENGTNASLATIPDGTDRFALGSVSRREARFKSLRFVPPTTLSVGTSDAVVFDGAEVPVLARVVPVVDPREPSFARVWASLAAGDTTTVTIEREAEQASLTVDGAAPSDLEAAADDGLGLVAAVAALVDVSGTAGTSQVRLLVMAPDGRAFETPLRLGAPGGPPLPAVVALADGRFLVVLEAAASGMELPPLLRFFVRCDP